VELVEEVKRLMEKGSVRRKVEKRIGEFERFRRRSWKEWFSELCFCILTANYTAEGGIRIQKEIRAEGFLKMGERELERKLRELGHRFPKTRARYIVEARKYAKELKKRVLGFRSGKRAREWLLGIRGIGMKEASHFLRNVGFKDVAIVDRHIVNLLAERGMMERPKSMSRGRYVEVERVLEKIAENAGLDLARLDLYLWYLKTGKILK